MFTRMQLPDVLGAQVVLIFGIEHGRPQINADTEPYLL